MSSKYSHHNSKQKKASNEFFRAKRLASEGRYSDACASLLSEPLAPLNEETYQKLQMKHPQGPTIHLPHTNTPDPLEINSKIVVAQLKRFPKGSAPGLSALSAQHILDAILPGEMTVVDPLTEIIKSLVSGKVLHDVMPFIAGANLTALIKKNSDIRPIAVGDTLRRLAARCLCSLLQVQAAKYFLPTQFGVAVPGGAEAIIHGLRLIWESNVDQDTALLKVDFSNAFNSVSRQLFLDQCLQVFPGIYSWVKWCYSSPSLLHYNNQFISSSEGVQQGDPLGPLLFCLVLHKLVEKIESQNNNIQANCWYFDDGSIIANPTVLADIIHLIQSDGPALGLHINLEKSEVIWQSSNVVYDIFPPQLTSHHVAEFDILGSPIGSSKHVANFLEGKLKKVAQLMEKFEQLEDPQVAYSLLRSCASFGKFSYYIRTVPPDMVKDSTIVFDVAVRSCFEKIVSSSLTDDQWSQCTLNLKCGGLGLRSVSMHAAAAYIASVTQNCEAIANSVCRSDVYDNHQHLTKAIATYNQSVIPIHCIATSSQCIPSQKKLSSAIDDTVYLSLCTRATLPQDKARLILL